MLYYSFKVLLTTLLVVVISELAKRNSMAASVLASVPLVSVLAMLWLYIDTKSIEQVSLLAGNIVWWVLPSLTLFILLPSLLKLGVNFYLSLTVAILATVLSYLLMLTALKYFGVKL